MKKISKKTKKKKVSRIINLIIIIVCVVVLIIAAYHILKVWIDFKNQSGQIEDAKDTVFETIASQETDSDDEAEDYDYFDFDALLAINSDSVGWIKMRGDSSDDLDNPIDYPIVQYTDNEYYLYRALDESYSSYGTIFLDYRMSMDDNLCFLWGHNMTNPDDAMFGYLNYYEDSDFYEKYPYYDVWIGSEHYTYKVFACGEVEVDGFFFTTSFTDSFTFENWLSNCFTTLTTYDTRLFDFTEDDHVIACVACVYPTDYTKRYVLLMYRVEEE